MSEPVLLEASGLSKSFGGVQAVRGLSLKVRAGELLALMGPNGAGKSTTFNLLNGQLTPDAGDLWVQGQRVTQHHPLHLWRLGVGRSFQVAQVFGAMTALAQVQLALQARARRQSGRWWRQLLTPLAHFEVEAAWAWLARLGLEQDAHCCPQAMPYGWVKRLELALCLCQEPRVVLMDEPTAGLAPEERQQLMQLTRDLAKAQGLGVIFTEHSLDAVFGYADRMVLMAQGQLVAQGHPDEVRQHPEAQALYFGSRA